MDFLVTCPLQNEVYHGRNVIDTTLIPSERYEIELLCLSHVEMHLRINPEFAVDQGVWIEPNMVPAINVSPVIS